MNTENIFIKTIAVINSCKTLEQLSTASEYAANALRFSKRGFASDDYFMYNELIDKKRKQINKMV